MSNVHSMDLRPGGGVVSAGARAWLGIPFAETPRFAAPQVRDFAEGTYDRFGAAPFQIEDPNQPLGARPDEDSAFLNVWAPEQPPTEQLPVIVTVYGGGFEHGAGSSWPADGSTLAATGTVVVVSFNYRVGALGFVTLSAVDSRFLDTSNLGLRDIIAALQWVRNNIARFGGDPERVTVVGESAGGFLAAALAAAPSADGLYARLAVHSAGASRIIDQGRAETMARDYLDELGAAGTLDPLSADALDLVRLQSAIVDTDIGRRNGPSPRALGVVDDSGFPDPVLIGHPADAIRGGRIRHVPILVSSTFDEIAPFRAFAPDSFDPPSMEAIVAEVVGFGVDPVRAEEIVEAYRDPIGDDDPGAVRARVLTDYIYRLAAVRLAQMQTEAGGVAHLYLVGRVNGEPAGHACDVGGLSGGHWPDSTPEAHARDSEITRIILDFASGHSLAWPEYSPESFAASAVGTVDEPAATTYARIARIWHDVPRP